MGEFPVGQRGPNRVCDPRANPDLLDKFSRFQEFILLTAGEIELAILLLGMQSAWCDSQKRGCEQDGCNKHSAVHRDSPPRRFETLNLEGLFHGVKARYGFWYRLHE